MILTSCLQAYLYTDLSAVDEDRAGYLLTVRALFIVQAYETALYSRLCDRINGLPEGWFTSPLVMKELAEASELARLEVTNHPEVSCLCCCTTFAHI